MREIVRHDRAHRRPGEELRERHDPGRLRDADARPARSAAARCTRSTRNSSASTRLRLRLLEDHGRPAARAAEAETLIAQPRGRPARGLPQPAGAPVLGQAQAQRRQRSRVRFRPAPGRRRRGARLLRPGAARPVPEVRRARLRDAQRVRVRERASGQERTCDFRSGRTILQRPIERAQMEKLLATGKTDLLQFVSTRTRRPFSAFLVRQPDGKVGFEFEAKEPGASAAGRNAARRCACSESIRATAARSSCIPDATVRTSSTAPSTRRCPTATRSMRSRSTKRSRCSTKNRASQRRGRGRVFVRHARRVRLRLARPKAA